MVSPNEINRLSSQVISCKSALDEKSRSTAFSANKTNSTWKGKISSAFNDSSKKTQTKTSRLLSDMGNLSRKLNTLASNMNRASAETILEPKRR